MSGFTPYDPNRPLPLLLLLEEPADTSIRSPLAEKPHYDNHIQGFPAARPAPGPCCSWSSEARDD